MITLTNNSLVTKLLEKNVNNSSIVVKTFQSLIKELVNGELTHDYTDDQLSNIKQMSFDDLFGLFEIWVDKIGINNLISKDEFVSRLIKENFTYNKFLEVKNPFVYVIEYVDLEADDVMRKSLTKCVFVGEENGFKNKSQAIAAFRANKKLGIFEATTVGRHKIKYFKKPEVMLYNDLGYDFIHELVEFKK